jgi:hypothetical protein
MASGLITQHSDFEPTKLSYGAPRVNARGGKAIKILDAKKNTLVLSTPLLLTWGINRMEDEDTGRVSYNFALQFPSSEYSSDAINNFFEKIKEFENKVLDDSVTHCKEWFGKSKLSREVSEALFTPILKYPRDKDTSEPDYSRSPTMRIKIPFWDNKFNVELYDTNGKAIFTPGNDIDSASFEGLIPKASHVSCAIQCNGIWFAAGKFGVTWQLVQAIVRRPVRIQGGCFLTLSEQDKKVVSDANKREEEEQDSQQAHEEDVGETPHQEPVDETQVEDSDDDEDTPPPEPVKKPKKRVVKKKKTT